MGLYKNVAGQKIAVYAVDSTTGLPKTGDAANITAQISKDFGSATATNDTNPTELDATDHPGVYVFDLTQDETNADNILISAVSATSGIILDPIQVFTVPPNFRALAIESDGMAHADLKEYKGVVPANAVGGTNLLPAAVSAIGGSTAGAQAFGAWMATAGTIVSEATNAGDYTIELAGDYSYLHERVLYGQTGVNAGRFLKIQSAVYDSEDDSTLITLHPRTADSQVNENDTFFLVPWSDPIAGYLGTGAVSSTSINDNAITASKVAASALNGKGDWAKAGDEMDLINTPNATAVAAIQAGLATKSDIDAINFSASRRMIIKTVAQMERPESSNIGYEIEARFFDASGAAVDPDEEPTVDVTGIATGGLPGLATFGQVSTGLWRGIYAVSHDATIQQLRFDVTAVMDEDTFVLSAYSQVCDFVAATWTTADRTKLDDLESRLTSARAGYLDKLNVSGTLANTDNIASAILPGIPEAIGMSEANLDSQLQGIAASAGNAETAAGNAALSAGEAKTAAEEAKSAAGSATAQAELAAKLLSADRYIDTGVSPWQLVLIEAGTGPLGDENAVELLRQDIKDVDGAGIETTATVVGQLVEAEE